MHLGFGGALNWVQLRGWLENLSQGFVGMLWHALAIFC